MRPHGCRSRRLTAGTISRPPGTGSSFGHSVVNPCWASTTSRHVSRGVSGPMRSLPRRAAAGLFRRPGGCGYNSPRLLGQEGSVMALDIRRVQVWSGEISDRPGAAAAKLEHLARAGADLECVFTRPHPTRPEGGLLYLAPIAGPEQTQAARAADL